jgi:hypothetical protein
LPAHEFRNGNLNQLGYSLLLFIRDVAGGDLVGWIDRRLPEAQEGPAEGRLGRMAQSIIEPLAGLHGASHKVLNMALCGVLRFPSQNPAIIAQTIAKSIFATYEQAGGAFFRNELVSIVKPGLVSWTDPAKGPLAWPHQLF